MQSSHSLPLRIYLPNISSHPMLEKAIHIATAKGIPAVLTNRKFIDIYDYHPLTYNNIIDLEDIKTDEHKSLFAFVSALQCSLSIALQRRFNFLTHHLYIKNIADFEAYVYFLIGALHYNEKGYEFLENEISEMSQVIEKTGTLSRTISFNESRSYSGQWNEHLIFSWFQAMYSKLSFDILSDAHLRDMQAIISIANHMPLLSQFAARNPYINITGNIKQNDWNNFINAGFEIISIIYHIYNMLNKDYWKTYHFFTNNDIRDVASILGISDIDEEAIENWVELPKTFTQYTKTYITVENLNYVKWNESSRY